MNGEGRCTHVINTDRLGGAIEERKTVHTKETCDALKKKLWGTVWKKRKGFPKVKKRKKNSVALVIMGEVQKGRG